MPLTDAPPDDLFLALAAAEQAAAQREAFFQVFEYIPAGIALLREPGHRYEYVNPAYQQLFPDRPLVNRTVAEAVPEAAEQGFVALLDQVYRTGETYVGQEELAVVAHPDGQPPRNTYFDYTYQALREAGHIVGISIFVTDVTERVLARRQREAQRAQLQELFMQAPAPIVILDGPALTYQLVNPAYQQIFPGRQLLGLPLLEALPELAGTEALARLDQVYQTGVTYVVQDLPIQLARRTGGPLEEIYFTFTYQARRDEHGAVDGALLFGYEVTDQVRARQQLAQANALLTAANRQLTHNNTDLDNFVYAASHDLKLPVLNLAGLFDELRRGVSFTDAAEEALLVPLITQALHQLSTSLDDLAALGQAQEAAHAPAEPVQLEDLVEEILHTLEPQVRAANARVTTDFAARPTLTYPRASLHTVLLNLLSNALKYADHTRPARIHCSLWLAAGEPVLWVKDNGVGFDAAGHGPELFQLFRRFHSHVEGTGVGLYLVNRLLLARGGHLEVDSQVGAGATFRAYLGPAEGL